MYLRTHLLSAQTVWSGRQCQRTGEALTRVATTSPVHQHQQDGLVDNVKELPTLTPVLSQILDKVKEQVTPVLSQTHLSISTSRMVWQTMSKSWYGDTDTCTVTNPPVHQHQQDGLVDNVKELATLTPVLSQTHLSISTSGMVW